MYKIGDRVRLNEEWGRWTQYAPSKTHPVGREGTVTGFPKKDKQCTKVTFDGKKGPTNFHTSFLTRIDS